LTYICARLQVVLVPIVLGMGLNYKFPKAVKKIEPFSPIVGVLSTILLVGSAVAQVRVQRNAAKTNSCPPTKKAKGGDRPGRRCAGIHRAARTETPEAPPATTNGPEAGTESGAGAQHQKAEKKKANRRTDAPD
jgi:hypothetical protein